MSDDGTLRATCRACLTRQRERRAALSAAVDIARQVEQEFEAAALQDGDAEGVEVPDVDEFDEAFGDGADLMNVDLPDDSALSQREAANDCLEDGFDLNLADGRCSRCRDDKGDPVGRWSAANKVHPGKSSCLKGLTDMEDMLIARVKSYMQVRWTKGRQLCRGNRYCDYPQRRC